jgi:carbon storage regulator
MLVLTRKVGQKVTIAEHVYVTLVAVGGNQVRLGIEAPKEVTVDRAEIRWRRQGAGGKAKAAPRSNIVDSPYNTSGPWSTAQGGGKSWMGQVNLPLSIAAPARPVAVNPMGPRPNNIAP